jgi:putative hemolysin
VSEIVGWSLLPLVPPLLAASAFCSCAETTVFGLTGADREWLRTQRPAAAARVDELLREPRALLVSVLLGNNIVNTLYFVVSTAIALSLEESLITEILVSVGMLVTLVLVGETLPKLLGNAARRSIVPWVGGPMLAMHRALRPVREAMDRFVLVPLARLGGLPADRTVQDRELGELLSQSQRRGVLAPEESRTIRRVTRLRGRRVQEVMTPRVDLSWITLGASREEIRAEVRRGGRRRLVVADPDLDAVVGFLDARAYLLDARGDRAPMRDHVGPASFIPEVASVDQLLSWFASSGKRAAIVVDEFGGTAGVVTLLDAVAEVAGHPDDAPGQAWVQVEPGVWDGAGDENLHEAFERLELGEPPSEADTVAGAVMESLGRVAQPGDSVMLGGARVEVTRMTGARIDRVRWRLGGAA